MMYIILVITVVTLKTIEQCSRSFWECWKLTAH